MDNILNYIFCLHPNCKTVYGHNRGAIYDLYYEEIHLIPNTLYKIINTYSGKSSFNKILQSYTSSEQEIIKEYFNFLYKNDLIYFIDTKIRIPSLSDVFNADSLITNCIVDIQEPNYEITIKSLRQLNYLQCKNIQLRFFKNINIDTLHTILKEIDKSIVSNIEIIIPFSNEMNISNIETVCKIYKRINTIYLYDYSEENMIYNEDLDINFIFTRKKISSSKYCGLICEKYFNLNIDLYHESLHHNTCLNRKIAIDAEGNIKNCPSMAESFGNIRDTTLEEAVSKPGFKKYWNITKDMITKCKDCEFRHVCTDCRAYTDHPEDMYSAPLKCGYDPYTCTWEEWSTHPLKQKAIDHYGMREIIGR